MRLQKCEHLDRLGEELSLLSPQDDAAAYQSVWMEIYSLSLNLYCTATMKEAQPDLEDAFQEVMIKVVTQFNPAKGSLSSFIHTRLNFAKADIARQKTDRGHIAGSIDEPIQDENHEDRVKQESHGDLDPQFEVLESAWMVDVQMYELVSQIIHFIQRPNKKTNNPVRLNYYKLFYTSGLLSLIKDFPVFPKFRHERDMLSAMKFSFADFCLIQPSRTLAQIYYTALKPYCQVVDADEWKTDTMHTSTPTSPIPLPIPDIVGISYLKRIECCDISASAYSQQKKHYNADMKNILRQKEMIS